MHITSILHITSQKGTGLFIWNNLPLDIRCYTTLGHFKSRLMVDLLDLFCVLFNYLFIFIFIFLICLGGGGGVSYLKFWHLSCWNAV